MFDWLGRVAFLVLSGLASFAILISLSTAIQTGADRNRAAQSAEQRSAPDYPDRPDPAASPTLVAENNTLDEKTEARIRAMETRQSTAVAVQQERSKWLEALTYAVLALTGFVAAGVIVMLRITATLARIADRRS